MRIAKLDIQSFRGIPNQCTLDFRDKKGNACSAIIYGGNGSGKSSIIDALEFNLQGRIEREDPHKHVLRPSPINMYYEDDRHAHTSIEFEDGCVNNRDIVMLYNQSSCVFIPKAEPKEAHELFRFASIVLRRNDIISFNRTVNDSKQVVLSKVFLDFSLKERTSDDPEVLLLNKEISRLNDQRDAIIKELEKLLPIDLGDLEEAKKKNSNMVDYIKSRFTIIGSIDFTKSKKPKATLHQKDYDRAIKQAQECEAVSSLIKEKRKEKRQRDPKRIEPNKFEPLNGPLAQAGNYLSKAFKEISNVDYVDYIEFRISKATEASFEIIIHLNNGREVSPENIFSEANYDLMILLLYVSMIRVSTEKGQEKVLVLDDVLQSVDATIRTKFMSYILREFNDWQLFITCHDRAWLNQLRYLFNNLEQGGYHPFKEFNIVGWSFDNGPIIKESKSSGVDERLLKAIETNDIHVIASTAGPFFEMICENLSMSLHSQIYRNPDDSYTIHDLWFGLKKVLSKIGLEKEVNELDRFSFIRNMISCHYTQWSEGISDYEILRFAKAVQSLYEKTFCRECLSWISGKYNEDKCCNKRHLVYKRAQY
jgi:recombinational DNA repair ATPase RecF